MGKKKLKKMGSGPPIKRRHYFLRKEMGVVNKKRKMGKKWALKKMLPPKKKDKKTKMSHETFEFASLIHNLHKN